MISISDDDKIKDVNIATGNAKSKITVNSKNKGEANFKLRLAGGELEYEVVTKLGYSAPKQKEKYSDFGMVVYEKKTYTVNYKVISDPDTDGAEPDTNITTTLPSYITKTSLEDGLNKIYQQGVVSWDVTDSGTQDIMFDTNNSGTLDESRKEYTNFNTMEVTNITRGEYDELNNLGKDTNFDRNVFFVDMRTNSARLGINPNFGRLIDVHPDRHINLSLSIPPTVAHELGHSLKLEHVDQIFPSEYISFYGYTATLPVIIARKSGNLMISRINGNLMILLKKQWDKINK